MYKIIASGKLAHEKVLCTNLLSTIVKVLADQPDATIPCSSVLPSRLYIFNQPSEGHRIKEFICQLFSMLTAVGSNDLFTSFIGTLCTKPVRYPVLELLGPAIIDFFKSTKVEKDGPLQVILAYCISQLEVSIGKVVAPTTITKNNASYEKEVKKHQKEQVLLVSLKALLPATDVDVPPGNEPPAKKQKATSKVVAGSSSHVDLT